MSGGKEVNAVGDGNEFGGDFCERRDCGCIRGRGWVEDESCFCDVVTEDREEGKEIGADECWVCGYLFTVCEGDIARVEDLEESLAGGVWHRGGGCDSRGT